MELKFSQLDNVNTMNPYNTFDYKTLEEQNSTNYWEKPIKTDNPEKRKKVSFNDILSNMNLVVNKQGVLQFMTPNQQNSSLQQTSYQSENNQYNENEFVKSNNQKQNIVNQQKNINYKGDFLEPSVKHSYIYNKYFKDYSDPNYEKPSPRVPKTIEEYHQMILEDKIKALQQKKRIEQIKSTKLMFTSAPGSESNPRNVKATKNNLRTMNFR